VAFVQLPQRLKPLQNQIVIRSAEALRHPKSALRTKAEGNRVRPLRVRLEQKQFTPGPSLRLKNGCAQDDAPR
jgi:hypothetical protein